MWRVSVVLVFAALGLSACTDPTHSISDRTPADFPLFQNRRFTIIDQAFVLAAAKTLLETGFVLDRVDPQGKVWASAETYFLSFKVVATVTPRGVGTMQVRFVADKSQESDIIEVDDPKFYEDKFFRPLAQNLRLPAGPAT